MSAICVHSERIQRGIVICFFSTELCRLDWSCANLFRSGCTEDGVNQCCSLRDGNVTHITDPNAIAGLQPTNSEGATIYREYDELNRLVRSLDAEDGETLYRYDLLGNLTGVTDAEGQTRLTFAFQPVEEAA